jgi:glycosyltransferase involved in cell wall biosynthesis
MHAPKDTRIFRNECVSLAEFGYEVYLCIPIDKREKENNVNFIPVLKPKTFLDRVFNSPRDAVKVAEALNADLYHFHDPELLFVMARLAKKGKKVIWDAHENYLDTIFSFNSLKVKFVSLLGAKLFNYFELKYCKSRFSGVVTITEKMAEKYRNRKINVCVAGNFSKVGQVPGKQSYNINEEIVFISSGMQFKERGIFEMVESLKLLPNEKKYKLRFAGSFKDESLKELLIKNVGKDRKDFLEFGGPYNWQELVNNQIPKADVGFVLFDISDPNNCNGLPNRFFECWSNGVPVITTAGTLVSKIVEEIGGGIVISSNSPTKIAEAMIVFIENPSLIEIMGKKARQAVQDKYSWEVAIKNIEKLYKQVLS